MVYHAATAWTCWFDNIMARTGLLRSRLLQTTRDRGFWNSFTHPCSWLSLIKASTFNGNVLRWMTSFVTDQMQQVVHNGMSTVVQWVCYGIPLPQSLISLGYTSVRQISISDIGYLHNGCNLNNWEWNDNRTLISEMPNMQRLVYDVVVAAIRLLTWHQNLLCMRSGHKMPMHVVSILVRQSLDTPQSGLLSLPLHSGYSYIMGRGEKWVVVSQLQQQCTLRLSSVFCWLPVIASRNICHPSCCHLIDRVALTAAYLPTNSYRI